MSKVLFDAIAVRELATSDAPVLTLVHDGGAYALHAFAATVGPSPSRAIKPLNARAPEVVTGDDWSQAFPAGNEVFCWLRAQAPEELKRRAALVEVHITPRSVVLAVTAKV